MVSPRELPRLYFSRAVYEPFAASYVVTLKLAEESFLVAFEVQISILWLFLSALSATASLTWQRRAI